MKRETHRELDEGWRMPFFLIAIEVFVILVALRLLGAPSLDEFEQGGDRY